MHLWQKIFAQPVFRRQLWQWVFSSKAVVAVLGGFVVAKEVLSPRLSLASVYDTVRQHFRNRPLMTVEGKQPLIRITSRPYNLETPLHYLTTAITPNDAFFVRSRLALMPTDDAISYRLVVQGAVTHTLELTLRDLQTQFEPVSMTAVAQCSGNSMAFFSPPVIPGWNLTHGFMGCARWTGVRVQEVLAKAGLRRGARTVIFKGADRPVIDKTPLVEKSFQLSAEQTLGEDFLIAYAMNGQPLPYLNGYPVRLVAPGWYGTYWVKWLERMTVTEDDFQGFWMSQAYRVPTQRVMPYAPSGETRPIARYNVKSVITAPGDREQRPVMQPIEVTGVAFDSGVGIQSVDVSIDGGTTWQQARMRPADEKYAWHIWTAIVTPRALGVVTIMSRATSIDGTTQPVQAVWNAGGYMYNAIDSIDLIVSPS